MSRFLTHLPRRTVRFRLALAYSGLFLAAGFALLAITYLLVERNTDVPAGSFPAEGDAGAPNDRLDEGEVAAPDLPPNADEIVHAVAVEQNETQMRELLVWSGVALVGMSVLSIGLGWFVAGRVLRPLRTITAAARNISTSNLDQRLRLDGPDDELKELGDTFDGLLDRLEAAFGAQRHFVANASHEMRTPLTLSRALLQMTLTDPHATLETFRGRAKT